MKSDKEQVMIFTLGVLVGVGAVTILFLVLTLFPK